MLYICFVLVACQVATHSFFLRGGCGETTRVCPCQSVKKSSYPERDQRWLLCCYIVAERMSERAEDDVRGEQRRAARQQLKQQQIQRGEGSTAMATVAERRSLPSPEIMLGQPWSNWVDNAKLHGNDGEFPSVPNVREKARWSAAVASPVPFLGRLHAVFGGIWRNATGSNSTGRQASATIYLSVCRIASFSGAESEESFKDFGKNREAMRLCREGECVFFPLCRAKGVFWFWRFNTQTYTHSWIQTLYKRHLGQNVKPTINHAHHEFTGQPDIISETCVLFVW